MIRSKADLAEYLAADFRHYGVPGWRTRFRLTRRVIYWQWLLRRCEYWTNCRRDPVGRVVGKVLQLRVVLLGERLGFSIPINVFGPGLRIGHIGNIVVNDGAVVGARCRISQRATIGQAHGERPVIGDDVWIGPGAVISGAVKVGTGAAVAANAVVTRDVEPDTTVAGVPARKIADHGYRKNAPQP